MAEKEPEGRVQNMPTLGISAWMTKVMELL